MNGNQVRPEKWTNVIDLYDNGWYSYIWGNYDGGSDKSLGARWNGGKNVGYPNHGAYPTWYVEPDFVTNDILFSIYKDVQINPQNGNLNNIKTAIMENI